MNTYAADTLPDKPRLHRPAAYIANLSPLSSPGTHWVCFFFPVTGIPEYFDTFSLDIPSPFCDFIGQPYKQNTKIIQSPLNTTCGQHVIYYIYQRCRNISMEKILDKYSITDLHLNDVLVNQIVNQNFGLQLPLVNEEFINEQLLL